MEDNKAY